MENASNSTKILGASFSFLWQKNEIGSRQLLGAGHATRHEKPKARKPKPRNDDKWARPREGHRATSAKTEAHPPGPGKRRRTKEHRVVPAGKPG